jgi:hypothetical protein
MPIDAARFMRVYANLPLNLRNEVIAVIDDVGPITWHAAYLEINQKTKIGELIIKRLSDMGII